MSEKKGVKELMEVLAGLEVLACTAAKVLKDGKVRLDDLGHLAAAAGDLGKVVEAVAGADEVLAEVKDLDGEEAKQVVEKVVQLVSKVKADLKDEE